jgi:multiple sugar transport system ATP-binding protein
MNPKRILLIQETQMSKLLLKNVLKIYPYTKVSGIFGRKKAREALAREQLNPYTTNEGVVAVQNFNLEVESGEFIVLLGPSGCGKSTVLRMIAGLEEVSAGEIFMDGVKINDLKPELRDLSMIFQNYSLYSHFTVYENLAFPLKNLHIPRDELDRIVLDVASALNLSDLLDRKPKELSGGERQRVAIGRSIVRKPKLFLMDEPFSNLDAPLRQKLRILIKNLHEKLGTTFIYVTHDQLEAFTLGDKIVVMRDGIIEQVGTPREIYNRPANLYTAALVGLPRMNIFENVRLRQSSGDWTVNLFGSEYLLPKNKSAGLSQNLSESIVTLGIRPVHVEISGSGILAKIQYIEHMGSEIYLHLLIDGKELVAVQPAEKAEYGTYIKNQDVGITFQAHRFHLFDPQTEIRIG